MSVPFIKFVYWNENEWMSNFFQLTLNNCPVHHVADSNKAAAPAFSFAGRHEVKVGTEIDESAFLTFAFLRLRVRPRRQTFTTHPV